MAPSASAASICARGVCENTSRVTAVMIGRIITASTTPTTSIVRPVADAGPSNSGMNPSLSSSQVLSPTEAGPSTKMPQSP